MGLNSGAIFDLTARFEQLNRVMHSAINKNNLFMVISLQDRHLNPIEKGFKVMDLPNKL
jgi:hypothetical protein